MTRRQIRRIDEIPRLAKRKVDAHKGDFGHVLIVGGSRGMIGAVSLATNAALCGGAGLVTFAVPETVQLCIATLCPCATSVPLACNQSGELAILAVRQMLDTAGECDALGIGPGMGVGTVQENIVRAAIESSRKPVVLDADGLNNLVNIVGWPRLRQCPLILTPHPGEFARLTARTIAEIQADRKSAAIAATSQWAEESSTDQPLICALKGAGTVVTDGKRVYINSTGNPGMATGGSGDVLTGLIAALVAGGMEPFDSVSLAVHCHGLAGDLAEKKLGEVSLTAADLLEFLPQAILRMERR